MSRESTWSSATSRRWRVWPLNCWRIEPMDALLRDVVPARSTAYAAFLSAAEDRARRDPIVLLAAVHFEDVRAYLDGLEQVGFLSRGRPADRLDPEAPAHMACPSCGDLPHWHVGPVANARQEIAAARAEVDPGGRSYGSGSWLERKSADRRLVLVVGHRAKSLGRAEGWRTAPNTFLTRPVSTASPEYITVTELQVSRMSPRLCEMKSEEVPERAVRSLTSATMPASTVTSSAVSSARRG